MLRLRIVYESCVVLVVDSNLAEANGKGYRILRLMIINVAIYTDI